MAEVKVNNYESKWIVLVHSRLSVSLILIKQNRKKYFYSFLVKFNLYSEDYAVLFYI